MHCNKYVQTILNLVIYYNIVVTARLNKAIKLLDEDATSVEASTSFSVCGHMSTSDTSDHLYFTNCTCV